MGNSALDFIFIFFDPNFKWIFSYEKLCRLEMFLLSLHIKGLVFCGSCLLIISKCIQEHPVCAVLGVAQLYNESFDQSSHTQFFFLEFCVFLFGKLTNTRAGNQLKDKGMCSLSSSRDIQTVIVHSSLGLLV